MPGENECRFERRYEVIVAFFTEEGILCQHLAHLRTSFVLPWGRARLLSGLALPRIPQAGVSHFSAISFLRTAQTFQCVLQM